MSILNNSYEPMVQHSGLIERLPTEILHQIFDYIDAETILLSIRRVCRQWMAWTNTYNRYGLNLNSISKQNFPLICRLIQPENVISLTLADNNPHADQTDLFLSLVDTQRFTRLRSLIFLGIDDIKFHAFTNSTKLASLQTFAIKILKYDRRRSKTSTKILTRICSQVNIRKLDLNVPNVYWKNLNWPTHCSIKELKVHQSIFFNYLCQILQYSSQLETLILSISLYYLISGVVLNSTLTPLFRQLTSLTFEFCDIDMNRWFVFIEHVVHDPTVIRLFTTPIDQPNYEHEKDPQKTYLSNIVEKERSYMLIMDTVSTFILALNEELANYFKQDVRIILT
ncbi:unnamed protein product [Rotaria sp. Silwood1]|nr:unnamed protein product [Rotaria sp. Silwood1]